MPSTAKVPASFAPLFDKGEAYIKSLFSELHMNPTRGTIHVGQQRYVLMRAESLFLSLFEQLAESFGEEQTRELIYNMARIIGRSDCRVFSSDRNVKDPNEKLSAGPVHFSHTGWALVVIHEDSSPSPDESYFLHYDHPNTFESECWQARGLPANRPICLFSAGYSAGWCSESYGLELHARELRCLAHEGDRCEFIMAPYDKLALHAARLRETWDSAGDK